MDEEAVETTETKDSELVTYTEEEQQQFQELFNKFDRDNSETIEPSELGDALRCLGCNPTDAECAQMIAEADGKANDNGKLEFSEFCEIMAKHRKSLDTEEEELKQAFKIFDKNGDGTIDRDELKKTMESAGLYGKMSEEELDEIIAGADVDGNGRIEYCELARIMVGLGR